MGLTAGPISYQRFFITGPFPDEPTDGLLKKVNQHGFGAGGLLPDDTQIGWVGPRHLLDSPVEGEQSIVGPYLHMNLRVDRLRAPASILKSYVQQEEQAALQASGRELLGKLERRKAREVATLRIEKEMRSGAFRRMTAYPVLIDGAAKSVYFGSLGATVGDKLMKQFSDTFGCALEPATVETVTRRLMAGAKNPAALDRLAPSHLVSPPADHAAIEGAGLAGDLAFIGRELLSWLWRRAEADQGGLALRTGETVSVMLDRTLKLKCDFGVSGVTTISADGAAALPEARAALRTGKQPVRAGLTVGGGAGEFRLTLDAARWAVSGMIVPEPDEPAKDVRTRLEERFDQVSEVAAMLDALLDYYLQRRLARDWPREFDELSRWAAGKPRGAARVEAGVA